MIDTADKKNYCELSEAMSFTFFAHFPIPTPFSWDIAVSDLGFVT